MTQKRDKWGRTPFQVHFAHWWWLWAIGLAAFVIWMKYIEVQHIDVFAWIGDRL